MTYDIVGVFVEPENSSDKEIMQCLERYMPFSSRLELNYLHQKKAADIVDLYDAGKRTQVYYLYSTVKVFHKEACFPDIYYLIGSEKT